MITGLWLGKVLEVCLSGISIIKHFKILLVIFVVLLSHANSSIRELLLGDSASIFKGLLPGVLEIGALDGGQLARGEGSLGIECGSVEQLGSNYCFGQHI